MCAGLSLTRTQRIYGFGICFGSGFIISLLSTIFFSFGNITGFAVLYTLGNIVSLMGTGFLIGFLSQFKVKDYLALFNFHTMLLSSVHLFLQKNLHKYILFDSILSYKTLILITSTYSLFVRKCSIQQEL